MPKKINLILLKGKKNKIDIKLVERGLSKSSKKTYLQKDEFSIGVQSDPSAEFMDLDKILLMKG